MAASKLKTDWLCIGSSGPTIDGRKIEKDWLYSMAETYDPARYTALIWPDHNRWWANNMGKVDSLRAVDNDDGTVSLFAILAPNDDYLWANRQGQYLYSSMEITENFPEAGQFYLSGLGATDSPASARTSEVRFDSKAQTVFFNESVKLDLHPKKDGSKSFLRRWLSGDKSDDNPEETDMDKETLKGFTDALKGLGEKFDTLSAKLEKPSEKPAGDDADKDKEAEKFSAMQAEIDDLKKKLEEATANKPEGITKEEFAALKKGLDDLTAAFHKALGEEGKDTTKPGAQTDDAEDLKAYI
jgi:hypothetical protein